MKTTNLEPFPFQNMFGLLLLEYSKMNQASDQDLAQFDPKKTHPLFIYNSITEIIDTKYIYMLSRRCLQLE